MFLFTVQLLYLKLNVLFGKGTGPFAFNLTLAEKKEKLWEIPIVHKNNA